MFRIDGPGAVGELPVAREGVNAPGFFGPGNPATGQMSTRVTYEWLNAVQEEIAAVITGAGIELSKENNAQLLAALGKLTVHPDDIILPDDKTIKKTDNYLVLNADLSSLAYSDSIKKVVKGDRAVTAGSIDDVTIPGEYSIAITGVDDLPVSLGQVSKMSVYGSAANSGASFAQGTTQILRAIRPNFTGTEIWFRHARDTNVWGPWEQVGGAMPHVQASLHADLTCAAQTETVVPFTADAGDTGNFANGVYTCPRAGLVFAMSLVRAYGMGASVGGASFNLRRDRGAQKGNQAEYNPNYTQTAEVTFKPSPIFALLPVLAGDKIYLSAYFQSQAQLSTANLTSAVDGTHYINTFSLAYLQ